VSFGGKDSYFPTGPNDKRPGNQQKTARTVKQCERVCSTDPKCTAFHFYLLDPGAPNNCWIWTKDYYIPNGSDKAYCFVKKDLAVTEEWIEDTTAFDVAREAEEAEKDGKRKPKPTKSLNDYDAEYNQILE